MNKKLIAVTIGDIDGIGIELLINLWRLRKIKNFVLITNYSLFNKYLRGKKIKLSIKIINSNEKINLFTGGNFLIFNIEAKSNIENTYKSLVQSYNLTIEKHCNAIITLPLSKKKLSSYLNKSFKEFNRIKNLQISISHTNEYATAFTILEISQV